MVILVLTLLLWHVMTVSHRTRLLTVTACQVARVTSDTRKEDPGEVVSMLLVQYALMSIL